MAIWAIGLMTGTVLDGNVDIAMVRTDGESIEEMGPAMLAPYPLFLLVDLGSVPALMLGLALNVVGSATFYAVPSATYQSKVFFELPNSDAISEQGYTLVNLRAGVELANGRYRIGGFARNLTNKKYLIDAGNTGGGFGDPTYIRGEPRFYGVEVAGTF